MSKGRRSQTRKSERRLQQAPSARFLKVGILDKQDPVFKAILKSGIPRAEIIAWTKKPEEYDKQLRRDRFVRTYPGLIPLVMGRLGWLPDPLFLQKILDEDGAASAVNAFRSLCPHTQNLNGTAFQRILNANFEKPYTNIETYLKDHSIDIWEAIIIRKKIKLPIHAGISLKIDPSNITTLLPVFRSAALAMNASPEFLFNLPFSYTLPILRGLYDNRAIATKGVSSDFLPKAPFARHTYACLLDVFGFLSNERDDFIGASENVQAFQDAVHGLHSLEGYEHGLVNILFWALRPYLPEAFHARYAEKYDPNCSTDELWRTLPTKTTFHLIVADRLVKNASELSICIETQDRNAFAHILKRCVQDDVTEQESLNALVCMFSREDNNEQYLTLRSLFENPVTAEGFRSKCSESFNASSSAKHEVIIKEDKPKIEHLSYIPTRFARDIETAADYHVDPKVRAQDQTLHARSLMPIETARELCRGLYEDFGQEIYRADAAGRRLANLLRIPETEVQVADSEEGELDTSRLTRVITDPTATAIYREKHILPIASHNTSATILIDCSKSMADDNKIQLAIIAAERLSKWLSTVGIPVEILGFTTCGQNYGVKKGRQDILRHIVFKSLNEPYDEKRVIESLCTILDKNNRGSTVLGEAVSWAQDRTIEHTHRRRILFVVTDGRPSMSYKADKGISDNAKAIVHLKTGIDWIKKRSRVELIGIGIQDDLSEYFKKAIRIQDPTQLVDAFAQPLIKLIDPLNAAHRRAQRAPQITAIKWKRERRGPR